MNMSYRQLRAFVLISRLGNFSRAAESLHITQSGLSAMMRELEANLKCRLFDRTTRTVTLTTAGEQLLPAATQAVHELELAASKLNDIDAKAKRSLSVAATPLVSSSLLPVVYQSMRRRYPDLYIRLIDCDLNRARTLVENGDVDFGLGFFFRASKGIERSLLCSFQLMHVTPLDSVQSEDGVEQQFTPGGTQFDLGSVPWSELKDATLIGLPSDNPIQQVVETHLRKIRHTDGERVPFNHFDTLIAMVAAGMGSAVIPTFALLACRRYRVKCAILTGPTVPLGFYRITKKGREHAPAMQEFTNTLVSLLPGLVESTTS